MITNFKIFENKNIIIQQPFLLRKSDYLYVSDELAKYILLTYVNKNKKYGDFAYKYNKTLYNLVKNNEK